MTFSAKTLLVMPQGLRKSWVFYGHLGLLVYNQNDNSYLVRECFIAIKIFNTLVIFKYDNLILVRRGQNISIEIRNLVI
jgi:hypothetical protein